MSKKSIAAEKVTYEAALGKLEESVRHLEKGDLTLEDSLKAFEDGIKWSRLCEEKLSEAKGKVEMLVKKAGGTVETKNFEAGE
jgi:exodeoxyribonuclease VII small subunit